LCHGSALEKYLIKKGVYGKTARDQAGENMKAMI
jgi:hypothetical protein